MTNIARTYHVSRIFRSTALARFSSILLSICIILVLGVLPAAAGPVPGTDEQNPNVNPLVRCEPTAVSANVGDTVTIDLYIQDVSNLYGLDFRVSYNPTIGQVVDQNMYIPGTQIQPLWLDGSRIHYQAGHLFTLRHPAQLWCALYLVGVYAA